MCGSLCVQACCVSVCESVVCMCGSLCVQVRERDVSDSYKVARERTVCSSLCERVVCGCVLCMKALCVDVCMCSSLCVKGVRMFKRDVCSRLCVREVCHAKRRWMSPSATPATPSATPATQSAAASPAMPATQNQSIWV